MNEKMERLLTILQDVNDEIDFAHERHMVDDGLIDSLELMKTLGVTSVTIPIAAAVEKPMTCELTQERWSRRTSTARRRFWRW